MAPIWSLRSAVITSAEGARDFGHRGLYTPCLDSGESLGTSLAYSASTKSITATLSPASTALFSGNPGIWISATT